MIQNIFYFRKSIKTRFANNFPPLITLDSHPSPVRHSVWHGGTQSFRFFSYCWHAPRTKSQEAVQFSQRTSFLLSSLFLSLSLAHVCAQHSLHSTRVDMAHCPPFPTGLLCTFHFSLRLRQCTRPGGGWRVPLAVDWPYLWWLYGVGVARSGRTGRGRVWAGLGGAGQASHRVRTQVRVRGRRGRGAYAGRWGSISSGWWAAPACGACSPPRSRASRTRSRWG